RDSVERSPPLAGSSSSARPPLLCTRSILQSTHLVALHKKRRVSIYETEALKVDTHNKQVTIADLSEIKGNVNNMTIPYDMLVYAIGAETPTFGISSVKEVTLLLREGTSRRCEPPRARPRLNRLCRAFPDQSKEKVDRLMHMIVVGGGPTGVYCSGELHNLIKDDLRSWYPELADELKITLIEASPNVLPMFSRELIQCTKSAFKEQNIEVSTKTMVKEVRDKTVVVKNDKGQIEELPYGLLVWPAANV
ncbi:NADH:ubiquinone oxidoreductase, partial [Tulasnella sp. 417]